MKRITLAIAVLLAAPAALAQGDDPSCDVYNQLIEAAPSGLAEFRGAPFPGRPGVYSSTLVPRGFASCAIITGETPSMICMTPPLKEAGADMRHMGQMLSFSVCLKGWDVKPPFTDDLPTPPPGQPGLVMEEGSRFVQRRGDLEISFGVITARLDVPEPAPRIVGFGFRWKPPELGV